MITPSIDFSNYLTSVSNDYDTWWRKDAFIEEINENTWFEFPLAVIDQTTTSSRNENPKQALSEILKDPRRQIFLTGSPGAGKSTLLAKALKELARRAQVDHESQIPVLIKIRDYASTNHSSDIGGLILKSLRSHDYSLQEEAVRILIIENRLLLLIDGINEKPEAIGELQSFCRNIPFVGTCRHRSDTWGRNPTLEIQPLRKSSVQNFFQQHINNIDYQALELLGERVQDFGQTALIVWMLYFIFKTNGYIPESKGETYRIFNYSYKNTKRGINLDNSTSLLGELAFEMMDSLNPHEDPTSFQLQITESDARNILSSELLFKNMLNHLIKQQGALGNCRISFCHQSLQEYYAAEHLLRLWKDGSIWQHEPINGGNYTFFQQTYLNYHKWTESISFLCGLLDSKESCIALIKQAFEVDYFLGAKLVGASKRICWEEAIGLIYSLDISITLRVILLGETQLEYAVEKLHEIYVHYLNPTRERLENEFYRFSDFARTAPYPHADVRCAIASSCYRIGRGRALELLKILGMDHNQYVVQEAIESLMRINTDESLDVILDLLKGEVSEREGSAEHPGISISRAAFERIAERGTDNLIRLFEAQERRIRNDALETIWDLKRNRKIDITPSIIDATIHLLENETDPLVQESAMDVLALYDCSNTQFVERITNIISSTIENIVCRENAESVRSYRHACCAGIEALIKLNSSQVIKPLIIRLFREEKFASYIIIFLLASPSNEVQNHYRLGDHARQTDFNRAHALLEDSPNSQEAKIQTINELLDNWIL